MPIQPVITRWAGTSQRLRRLTVVQSTLIVSAPPTARSGSDRSLAVVLQHVWTESLRAPVDVVCSSGPWDVFSGWSVLDQKHSAVQGLVIDELEVGGRHVRKGSFPSGVARDQRKGHEP